MRRGIEQQRRFAQQQKELRDYRANMPGRKTGSEASTRTPEGSDIPRAAPNVRDQAATNVSMSADDQARYAKNYEELQQLLKRADEEGPSPGNISAWNSWRGYDEDENIPGRSVWEGGTLPGRGDLEDTEKEMERRLQQPFHEPKYWEWAQPRGGKPGHFYNPQTGEPQGQPINYRRLDGAIAPQQNVTGNVNVTVNSNGTKAKTDVEADDFWQGTSVRQHRQMQRTEDAAQVDI
jgi:hypothetical protein